MAGVQMTVSVSDKKGGRYLLAFLKTGVLKSGTMKASAVFKTYHVPNV